MPVGLSTEDAGAHFDSLQKKLVPLWRSIECFNQDEQTIVVVPSMSIDMAITGLEVQAYEERFLFLLLLLIQPRARMIYVTSQAIHPSVIEYYLDLLPGIIPRHAMRRLTLLAPYDDSPRPLSLKLLERPRFLQQIEAGIADKDRAHLVCYNTTYFERNLALRLGIPLYGADPRTFLSKTRRAAGSSSSKPGSIIPSGSITWNAWRQLGRPCSRCAGSACRQLPLQPGKFLGIFPQPSLKPTDLFFRVLSFIKTPKHLPSS